VASNGEHERRAFTDAELSALLAAGKPDEAGVVKLLALSGMRIDSDLYSLRVKDCAGGWFSVEDGKGGKARRVSIHTGRVDIVARYAEGKKAGITCCRATGRPDATRP
jgi:integrase